MRIILLLIQKEFRQILRTKVMLVIIFVMPIVQLFIMANALTFDIKNLRISVVNQDQSGFSSKLIHKIDASEYFQITNYAESSKIAEVDLMKIKLIYISKFPETLKKIL